MGFHYARDQYYAMVDENRRLHQQPMFIVGEMAIFRQQFREARTLMLVTFRAP
jgi:hypothetical protein